MSTRNRSRSRSTTNQTQTTSSPATPFAEGLLPRIEAAGNNALNVGAYTGPVQAVPGLLSRYTPQVDQITAYSPTESVAVQGNTGATGGLQDATGATGVMGSTGQNLQDFWNQVSAGNFMGPNQYLDQYVQRLQDNHNINQTRTNNFFNQNAVSQGAYGNLNTERGRAFTLGEQDRVFGDAMSQLMFQNYQAAMAQRERAGAGARDALATSQAPWAAMNSWEGVLNAIRQQEIDNANQTGMAQEAAAGRQGGYNWNVNNAEIQNDIMRNAAELDFNQANINNQMAQHEALRNGNLGTYAQLMQLYGLFPGSSTNINGTTTTDTTNSVSGAGPIVSGLAGLGSLFAGGPLAGLLGMGRTAGTTGALGSFLSGSGIGSINPFQNFLGVWPRG